MLNECSCKADFNSPTWCQMLADLCRCNFCHYIPKSPYGVQRRRGPRQVWFGPRQVLTCRALGLRSDYSSTILPPRYTSCDARAHFVRRNASSLHRRWSILVPPLGPACHSTPPISSDAVDQASQHDTKLGGCGWRRASPRSRARLQTRAHGACLNTPLRRGRWARSALYPFGALVWACRWRVPRGSVSGCMHCGDFAWGTPN